MCTNFKFKLCSMSLPHRGRLILQALTHNNRHGFCTNSVRNAVAHKTEMSKKIILIFCKKNFVIVHG